MPKPAPGMAQSMAPSLAPSLAQGVAQSVAPGLLVGGVASGCGKTTFTLALMAALRQRGWTVQGFKVGPDYIDPGLHRLATGRLSWNLDGWMGGHEDVLYCYSQALKNAACTQDDTGIVDESIFLALPARDRFYQNVAAKNIFGRDVPGKDVSGKEAPDAPTVDSLSKKLIGVVEGVMGLFDGASGHNDSGSSAEIAAWLQLPVILLVDARGMARSVAALVRGYASMRADVHIAGVVCTRVNSANHRSLLADALASSLPDIPLLGCLPTDPVADLPARHLGLITAEDAPLSPSRLHALAQWCEAHVDVTAIEGLAARPVTTPSCAPACVQHCMPDGAPQLVANFTSGLPCTPASTPASAPASSLSFSDTSSSSLFRKAHPVRIALARDAAFCFVYPALEAAFRAAGACIIPFSPLADRHLPPCDGLWLPGGYPELHAPQLAANTSLRADIIQAVAGGLRIHGECGGYIWLCASLHLKGESFPMLGCLPLHMKLGTQRAALGYRSVRTLADGPFGPAGTSLRGHEFHYAALVGTQQASYTYPECLAPLWLSHDRTGRERGPEGVLHGRVSASWVHLYPASAPDALPSFVAGARSPSPRSTP